MNKFVDDEFIGIAKKILENNKSEKEWSEVESDDMFQSENYCGGFDSIEMAFCFSFYSEGSEFWFQFTLNEARDILSGDIAYFEIRPAE